MSKNMVEPERQQMTLWRRVACWIIKATRAQTQCRARAPTPTPQPPHTYVIHIASPRQKWLRERASVLRYTYIACVVHT